MSIYKYRLGSDGPKQNHNKDEQALLAGVTEFCQLAEQFQPDLIFIACGADEQTEEPLSSLQFTVDAFKSVAKLLKSTFPATPILMARAGGHLPDSRTLEVWAAIARGISRNASRLNECVANLA